MGRAIINKSLVQFSVEGWGCVPSLLFTWGLVAQTVKCLPAMREIWVRFLGQEDLLEKEIAIHSSTLAWKIPWMEEAGRLHTVHVVAKVGHD